MTAYFIVRAQVADAALKVDFDRWYHDEHLPDALNGFKARRAWRGWSEVDASVHYAFYEFNDMAQAQAIQCSDALKRLVVEFDRAWGDKVMRTRDVVDVIQSIDARQRADARKLSNSELAFGAAGICLGTSLEDFTRRGLHGMLWRHLQERPRKARAGIMQRQQSHAPSPGIPSDIPPMPPNPESPDIVLPPKFPPRKPPEKLPPRVPPPPRPEPPRTPPPRSRAVGSRASEVPGGRKRRITGLAAGTGQSLQLVGDGP